MTNLQIKKIFAQIEDHEARIKALEGQGTLLDKKKNPGEVKQKTLREIVRGKKFKNGQEQIAVIVGYHENVIGTLVKEDNLKKEWDNAKMTNKYNSTFVKRAKDDLIRIHNDSTCDLTQSGEEFFNKFSKNESAE